MPEPHSWNEEDTAKITYFGEEAWQKVQSRLSELIGANLHFIPPTETFRCLSANNYPSCSDLATDAHPSEVSRCLNEAFEFGILRRQDIITCAHRLHYAVTQIRIKTQFIGTVLIGPLLLGKRESLEAYAKICDELGLEKEPFLDCIRELRVFSFSSIHSISACIEDVFKYVTRINSHF